MLIGLRQFLTGISCSLALTSILWPAAAQACRDELYPVSFPIAELEAYKHVYVVQVDSVTFDLKSRDSVPFIFHGKVVRTFKGPRQPGEVIIGTMSYARCSIFLDAGKTYLLTLNDNLSANDNLSVAELSALYDWSGVVLKTPYALPLYRSFSVPSDSLEFQRYVTDLSKRARWMLPPMELFTIADRSARSLAPTVRTRIHELGATELLPQTAPALHGRERTP